MFDHRQRAAIAAFALTALSVWAARESDAPVRHRTDPVEPPSAGDAPFPNNPDSLGFVSVPPRSVHSPEQEAMLRAKVETMQAVHEIALAFQKFSPQDSVSQISTHWLQALAGNAAGVRVELDVSGDSRVLRIGPSNPTQLNYAFVDDETMIREAGRKSVLACYAPDKNTIFMPLRIRELCDLSDPTERLMAASVFVHEFAHANGASEYGAYSTQMDFLAKNHLNLNSPHMTGALAGLLFPNGDAILTHIFLGYSKSEYIAAVLERFSGDVSKKGAAAEWLPGGSKYDALKKKFDASWVAYKTTEIMQSENCTRKEANALIIKLEKEMARKKQTPYDYEQEQFPVYPPFKTYAAELQHKLGRSQRIDPAVVEGVYSYLDLLGTPRLELSQRLGAKSARALADSFTVKIDEILVEAKRLPPRPAH